jgi:hypothetical protein
VSPALTPAEIAARRVDGLRVVIAWILVALTGVALYMSWPALFDAATHVGGMPVERAWAFPLVVDLVTVAAMLLQLLVPNPRRGVKVFTGIVFGVYAGITILGNASEAALADPETLVLGFWPAVIVNSIPGISLVVTTHLASLNVFKLTEAMTAPPVAPRAIQPRSVRAVPHPSRGASRSEAGKQEKFAEVVRLRAEGKSFGEIQLATGIPKATASRWVKPPTTPDNEEGTSTT